MRISDWSSDVCSSDLRARSRHRRISPCPAPTRRRKLLIRAARHGARRAMLTSTAIVVAMIAAVPAHAGGSSVPWEATLQSIPERIAAPVPKIVAVILNILTRLDLSLRLTLG